MSTKKRKRSTLVSRSLDKNDYPETALTAFEWLIQYGTFHDLLILSRYFPQLVPVNSKVKLRGELSQLWQEARISLLSHGESSNPFTILVQALFNKRKHEKSNQYHATFVRCNPPLGYNRELFLLYCEAIPELWMSNIKSLQPQNVKITKPGMIKCLLK
jgi:hypothetical protein